MRAAITRVSSPVWSAGWVIITRITRVTASEPVITQVTAAAAIGARPGRLPLECGEVCAGAALPSEGVVWWQSALS